MENYYIVNVVILLRYITAKKIREILVNHCSVRLLYVTVRPIYALIVRL